MTDVTTIPRISFFVGLFLIGLNPEPLGQNLGQTPSRRTLDQQALKSFNGLIGEWRGVGQIQRNSAKGSWKESGVWKWKLDSREASLELTVKDGRHLQGLVLAPGSDSGQFVLMIKGRDGETRRLTGTINDRKQLVATSQDAQGPGIHKLTLSLLHDTRFLLLFEGREARSGPIARLGEVGFTREGVAFAAGDSAPVCIVTEGRGTIAVKYKGETFYVCCSGCKDLFEEDPEAILAEHRSRKGKPGGK